jgi:hypothetical protein
MFKLTVCTQVIKAGVLTLIFGIAFCGCFKTHPEDIVATAGDEVLTRAELSQRAGLPYDSLSLEVKQQFVQGWVEETLLLLEAQRRGFHKDPEIKNKLRELQRELLRSRLLRDVQGQSVPDDSMVASYYKAHKSEFVRVREEFDIELYWAPTRSSAELFRREAMKDIDLAEMAHPEVTMEGIWRTSADELQPEEAVELARLEPGKFASPLPMEEGFRLLRLREQFPAGQRIPLEDVRYEIRERLMLEASRSAMETLMAELSRNYPVTINLGDSL